MDNTTSSPAKTIPSATPATPFPVSHGDGSGAQPVASTYSDAGTGASGNSSNSGDTNPTTAKVADAAAAAVPVLDRLIRQATSGAHDAIDGLSSKAAALAGGLQGGVSKAGDTRDEWIESARDAIRQHPFATVAGALIVGAALLSLSSSRRD